MFCLIVAKGRVYCASVYTCEPCTYICRSTDDEDADDVVASGVTSKNAARLRRKSVQLYARGSKSSGQELTDDTDSVMTLHRDPLHRRNMLVWRDHWQPTSASHIPNMDRNNNDGMYYSDTLFCF